MNIIYCQGTDIHFIFTPCTACTSPEMCVVQSKNIPEEAKPAVLWRLEICYHTPSRVSHTDLVMFLSGRLRSDRRLGWWKHFQITWPLEEGWLFFATATCVAARYSAQYLQFSYFRVKAFYMWAICSVLIYEKCFMKKCIRLCDYSITWFIVAAVPHWTAKERFTVHLALAVRHFGILL